MTDPTAEPSHNPVLNGVSSSGAVAPENRDVYRAEPNMIPTEYQRAKRPGMYAPATTEPSQHAEYRAKIAAIVDEIGDYPFAAAEEILAVRDAEMERLRRLVDALQGARDSLVEERDRVYDQRDGLARRASLMRRNYIETATTEEQLRAENAILRVQSQDLARERGRLQFERDHLDAKTLASLRAKNAELARLRAQVAELAGLRVERDGWKQRHADVQAGMELKQTLIDRLKERAETALHLIGDVPPSGNHLLLAVRAALAESCAAPEPATPPTVSTIVDRATGERHEYPQRQWNPCFNAGDHHIHDEYHGNCCDRPSHWASSNGDTDA